MDRPSFFKPTQDDWCGSFKVYKWPIQLVEITCYRYQDEFAITATGTDDYSLMKRYTDERVYTADLMNIIDMVFVDRAPLSLMGFEINF